MEINCNFSLDGSRSWDQRCKFPMYSWQRCKLYIYFVQCSNANGHRRLQFPLYFLQRCILHIMILLCSLPGHPWANLAQNISQTLIIIYNVFKDTKKIAMFHAHGHPNVALNTFIIYNVVKNTSYPENFDIQMVNHLDWICIPADTLQLG